MARSAATARRWHAVVLSLVLGAWATVLATPPVQVQLRTPWSAPPLLYEILEAAHTEDRSAFFPLLNALLDPARGLGKAGSTDEYAYNAAVSVMDEHGLLNEAGLRSNWDASLALHAESTRVSAFWQMYETAGLPARQEQAATSDAQCDGSWVDYAGQVLCSSGSVKNAVQGTGNAPRPYPDLIPLDHVYGSHSTTSINGSIAILYADPYASNTRELHETLSALASPHVHYILRWKPSSRRGNPTLSGYGASLDLKKVDYLVIDDRKLVDTAAARHADDASAQSIAPHDQAARDDRAWMDRLLKAHADDASASLGSLTSEELSDIAVKATHAIMKSRNPSRALRQLSQDFPAHAVSLARRAGKPSKSLVREAKALEAKTEAGGYHVSLNGKLISSSETELQLFGLLELLRSEREIVNALVDLGAQPVDAINALTSKNVSSAYVRSDASPPLFDASDRIEKADEEEGVISYWNDLEAEGDPRYARWPRDLTSLLRPMYPGSFPFIRLNVFNVILAMDLEKLTTIKFLSETVALASGKVGLRWGFVPINLDDEASASATLARYFWLVFDHHGPSTTAKYLRRVALACKGAETVDIGIAAEELDKIMETSSSEREALVAKVSDSKFVKARKWAERLRATPEGQGHVFLNGLYIPFHSALIQSLSQLITIQLQALIEPIYFGKVDAETTNMSTYFYDLPTTYKSRSALLFPNEGSRIKTKSISLHKLYKQAKELLVPGKEEDRFNTAIWLVGDFSDSKGAHFVQEAVGAVKRTPARLAFVHRGALPAESDALVHRLQSLAASEKKVDAEGIAACVSVVSACPEDSSEQRLVQLTRTAADFSEALDLPLGSYGVLVNGRLIYDFDPSELTSSDFTALLAEESDKARVVANVINSSSADQAIIASSIILNAFFVPPDREGMFMTTSTTRSDAFDLIANKETTFTIGDRQTAKLHFDMLLDPLSPYVQRWSSIIQMLSRLEDAHVRVTLSPNMNITSPPIKRFYRYSSPSKMAFDTNGSVASSTLSFLDMPEDAVLTMDLDAPLTWLTMAEEAIYDLDNIRLRDAVTPSVTATYELKNILIEGHARDALTRSVPRGLQLILETLDGSTQLDTIVMANLAYFQFHAAPGLYRLRIREGRSSDLYDMHSVGNLGWDSPPVNETGDYITLGSIQGLTIYPRVAKKKDRLLDRLVEDEEEQQVVNTTEADGKQESVSLLGKAQKVLDSLKPAAATQMDKANHNPHAEINVFTVASGHLYERMTYIMVLSVLKHTNHSVKFWFIENFLSPSFKSFIPLLAQEYNFTYELVTYAWPHWLRHQSEKQRSIWGMKVLFLDVLFPLDLNKVIFVDADQIVRADLIELINTDLHGAPYGLPPMGNDSFDMDNFRFWESGYWERFLQGKPYPISALFVVDLNRFRLVAAGDKLRGHYQALSADPGSLSNLDQDLVASMIHTVPIHSLDKEWLWCETWCSWDWYNRAKSIDLCSNPKTHEPKLDRARRQIPEWTKYDEEVASIARKFEQQGKLGANVVAANTDAVGAATAADPRTATMPASTAAHSHDEL